MITLSVIIRIGESTCSRLPSVLPLCSVQDYQISNLFIDFSNVHNCVAKFCNAYFKWWTDTKKEESGKPCQLQQMVSQIAKLMCTVQGIKRDYHIGCNVFALHLHWVLESAHISLHFSRFTRLVSQHYRPVEPGE